MLYVTKQIHSAFNDIVEYAINAEHTVPDSVPKYRLYSAHDTNIDAWVNQINPSYDLVNIPFASALYFELYRTIDTNDISIRTVFNGKPLYLEKCQGREYCPLNMWLQQMNTVLYQGNMREACFAKEEEDQN